MGKPGITPLGKIGKKYARIKYWFIREMIGEFIGTTILLFMIVGSNAQFLIKSETVGESQVVPIFGTIFGIMIAITVAGGVTGAHLNPALSIANTLHGDMSWYSLPGYFIGQAFGSVLGSLLAWSIIHPSMRDTFLPKGSNMSIPEFDEMEYNGVLPSLKIAGIFGPTKKGITVANGIATEMMETFMLIIIILAACDKQSSFKPPRYLLSIMIPLAIAGLCFSHDIPSGTVMNPVRGLGPRVAAWILGWKAESVFLSYDWDGNQQHWWLVDLFGPIIGAILAVLVYAFILGPQMNLEHLEGEEEEEEDKPPRFPDDDKKKKEEVLAAKRADADWRSTVFVPKPHVAAPVTHVSGYNYHSQSNNNDYQNQINYPNGNGYVNQRQPYQNQNRGY